MPISRGGILSPSPVIDKALVTHIFASAGTYSVKVTAEASNQTLPPTSLTVSVLPGFRGRPSGTEVSICPNKAKFALNFRCSTYSDSLTFILNAPDFQYSYSNTKLFSTKENKLEFIRQVNGKKCVVFIDTRGIVSSADTNMTPIASFTMGSTGKAYNDNYGVSTFKWNEKKGELRINVKKATLQNTLQLFGATNETKNGHGSNLG